LPTQLGFEDRDFFIGVNMARPPAIDPQYHDEIIEKYKTGLYSMSELAKPYSVTKQAIGTVLKRNGIKAVKKTNVQ
jgi:hypothetical protein